MSTVQVAQNNIDVVERLLDKICRTSHKGGAEGILSLDEGETPVRVVTCKPKGRIVSLGLRGSNRRHYGWSGKKDAITIKPISDNCFLLEVENESPLRLRL